MVDPEAVKRSTETKRGKNASALCVYLRAAREVAEKCLPRRHDGRDAEVGQQHRPSWDGHKTMQTATAKATVKRAKGEAWVG